MNTKYEPFYKEGTKREKEFIPFLEKVAGWKFERDATGYENAIEKWDQLWRLREKLCRLQFKGAKSRKRGKEAASTTVVPLEFRVEDRYGRGWDGWLRGKSDVLSFTLGQAYYLFYRKSLLVWAEKIAIRPKIELPSNPEEIVNYQTYFRPEHPNEEIMYAPLNDLTKNFRYIKVDKACS